MGWISLYEAHAGLQQKYPALLTNEALGIMEAAVRSAQPFVRGMASGRSFRELIGSGIEVNDYVVVFDSAIRDEGYRLRWLRVEVQWEKFILYVEENLLPAWISPKPAERKQAKPQEQPSRPELSPRRGPARNTVGFSKRDAELFPHLKRLMTEGCPSARAAALKLVLERKVAGNGSDDNKAKRLAGRFLKRQRAVGRNSVKLSETR
jgi:hypothetical protein